LPTGDANGSDVCAANEDVQAYIAALTEDAADQFGVGLVRLEGVVPHMYDLDWLRPRVLVDVPPLARTLLNLCFCGACMRRADAAGLDVERLRCVVMDNIEAEIRDGRSEAGVDRVAKLASNAELRAFAANHVQSGIDLLRVVRTQLRGRARISSNVSTPYGALLGASDEDGLLMRFIDATDQIAMHPANPIGNARVAALHARAAAKREISMLFARIQAPGAAGGAGQTGADQMERDLREAAERGADEISLYAYGLLREQDVAAFVAGVRRAFPL
jgi:hypothetical protein